MPTPPPSGPDSPPPARCRLTVPPARQLVLFLRLDDKTNRQLSCRLEPDDSGSLLTEELVRHGLVNEVGARRETRRDGGGGRRCVRNVVPRGVQSSCWVGG